MTPQLSGEGSELILGPMASGLDGSLQMAWVVQNPTQPARGFPSGWTGVLLVGSVRQGSTHLAGPMFVTPAFWKLSPEHYTWKSL